MIDLQTVLDQITPGIVASGIRIFQGCRLGETDEAHVAALLGRLNAPRGSVLLDAGCGIGEMARLMKIARPDLDFVLVNRNAVQLDYAPLEMIRIHADMHRIPLPTASVDGVMFCYSLCHSAYFIALMEAARLTKPGGLLFVYDYERLRGGNDLFRDRLYATAYTRAQIDFVAEAAGWNITEWERVEGDDTLFRDVYDNDAEYDLIFDDLAPVIWRAVRV